MDLCEAQHVADPEYKLGEHTVTIVFHRHFDSQNDSQKSLNERQKKIVMLMCKDRRISVSSIAVRLSLSRPTVYREIKKINTITELYWKGSAKTGHWEGKVFDSQSDSQNDSQSDSQK